MPKERSINPAQAQRKAEKAKAIKKGKAEQVTRRNEKLARRNPDRSQKQLDDLKAIETSGGKLTSHERKMLEELERDVKAVRKAREALGDRAPPLKSGFGGGRDGAGGRGGGVLGKRRRDWDDGESDESDVPEDVKAIPMPRDTPPPIPREIMDRWHKSRRERYGGGAGERGGQGTSANITPLGGPDRRGVVQTSGTGSGSDSAMVTPVVEAKTVYEAGPAIRDLRKEAVSAFVPAAVRMKMEKMKGVGGLVEPEEADRLEKEGYLAQASAGEKAQDRAEQGPRAVMMEEVEDNDD
ncbi:MAG: hypothetical protein M1818_008500 [Claussenomyces sp. TS43310]|nr:MAG: hypothetical protein M1818_008500 [Claussenomyces sp. TS43310]